MYTYRLKKNTSSTLPGKILKLRTLSEFLTGDCMSLEQPVATAVLSMSYRIMLWVITSQIEMLPAG